MIPKYLATLAVTVILATFLASSLQFATRSQVLSGKAVEETVELEFTIDAEGDQYYNISPRIAQFLKDHISFPTDGPARVVSTKVEITPKKVSWSENRKTFSAPGAAMAAQLHWETPSESPNGVHSNIYINFPEIPKLEGKPFTLRSGRFQKDDQGRYVVREVTSYRNDFQVSVARFVFALSAGLPFGIVLHGIGWAFVLRIEKRSRIAALPIRGAGWPQTFYPDPIAEWITWLAVLGIGGFVSSMLAGFSVADGFMSSSFVGFVYSVEAVVVVFALICVYFTRRSLLTVRVDSSSISYARGRGDLQWLTAIWSEIASLTEKSRTSRGSTTYWLELEFNDKRKKLKITRSIEGYSELRGILMSVFHG